MLWYNWSYSAKTTYTQTKTCLWLQSVKPNTTKFPTRRRTITKPYSKVGSVTWINFYHNVLSRDKIFYQVYITKMISVIYNGKCCVLTILKAWKKGLQCLISHKDNANTGNNLVIFRQNASIQTTYTFIPKYVTKCPEQTGIIDTRSTTNPFQLHPSPY